MHKDIEKKLEVFLEEIKLKECTEYCNVDSNEHPEETTQEHL